jgi:hypothetical protein
LYYLLDLWLLLLLSGNIQRVHASIKQHSKMNLNFPTWRLLWITLAMKSVEPPAGYSRTLPTHWYIEGQSGDSDGGH